MKDSTFIIPADMDPIEFDLLDIDDSPRVVFNGAFISTPSGYCLAEQASQTPTRRWRAAAIIGPGRPEFLAHYFRWPDPLPWAGFVMAENATITSEFATIVGSHMFVGNGMARPVAATPVKNISLPREGEFSRWGLQISPKSRTFAGVTCNVGHPAIPGQDPWVSDVMPRLHRVLDSQIKIDRFLLPKSMEGQNLEALTALGIGHDRILYVDPSVETLRCAKVVIPTFDRCGTEVRPELMNAHHTLAACLAKAEMAMDPSRLLFVVADASSAYRTLVDRARVEDQFRRRGFEIICTNGMSLSERVRLFAEARIVVGECGPALSNAVYARSGTRIGILQGAADMDYLSAQLAMVAGQEAWYLVGTSVGDNSDRSSFALDEQSTHTFISHILNS